MNGVEVRQLGSNLGNAAQISGYLLYFESDFHFFLKTISTLQIY
jgi:hypothetical protein